MFWKNCLTKSGKTIKYYMYMKFQDILGSGQNILMRKKEPVLIKSKYIYFPVKMYPFTRLNVPMEKNWCGGKEFKVWEVLFSQMHPHCNVDIVPAIIMSQFLFLIISLRLIYS